MGGRRAEGGRGQKGGRSEGTKERIRGQKLCGTGLVERERQSGRKREEEKEKTEEEMKKAEGAYRANRVPCPVAS